MNISFLRILLFATLLPFTASATDKNTYGMFPQPSEDQQRYVIEVPKQESEEDYRIQIFIGKEQMADCNQRVLFGKMERRELKGWGYHYYVVSDINSGIHRMMRCKEPPQKRFVAIQSDFLRYNSCIGTVVYVPKGYKIRYRIWRADDTMQRAQER